jgi:dephospho-CoA kinase
MANQSSQEEKSASASIGIENSQTIEDTWNQVQEAWRYLFPEDEKAKPARTPTLPQADGRAPELTESGLDVTRARPDQAEDIAKFINSLTGGKTNLTRMDVMAAFGEKAYMILSAGNQMVGVVGWQVENLVARVDEVWLVKNIGLSDALEALMTVIEEASRQLQAEAALVFVPPELAQETDTWTKLGYRLRPTGELTVNAWKQAARETISEGTQMLFKQLRVDRVLRPL